jgi:hypothetical protein
MYLTQKCMKHKYKSDTYVDCGILGCDALQSCRWLAMFLSNTDLSFDIYPENGSSTFLQNVGNHIQNYMVPQHRRPQSIFLLL